MTGAADYTVPDGPLCLSGPLSRPEPGALPLRGDLAHIALAGTHLAAHYVVPSVAEIGLADAPMYLQQRDDSEVMQTLASGTQVEILDMAGDWVWCCLGPQGPAGYVKADCLAA
ncbi:SH3 domain-containing protein [Erythrobacter sp. HA6-11]